MRLDDDVDETVPPCDDVIAGVFEDDSKTVVSSVKEPPSAVGREMTEVRLDVVVLSSQNPV